MCLISAGGAKKAPFQMGVMTTPSFLVQTHDKPQCPRSCRSNSWLRTMVFSKSGVSVLFCPFLGSIEDKGGINMQFGKVRIWRNHPFDSDGLALWK